MKFWNKFLLFVAVLYVCANVWPVIAAEAETGDAAAQTEEATLPDSTDMTLGFSEGAGTLPAEFRGGDPDSGLVHCLEDVYYEKQEHSLIYNPDAEALAEGAKFESEPNITWDTKVKDADGNWKTMSSQNTNVATDGGKFFSPGEYQIGNSGARQVAEGSGGAVDEEGAATDPDGEAAGGSSTEETVTGAPGGEAAGGSSTETSLVGEDGEVEGAGEKTVTAQQSMGVLVHDCTSPDLWVAFQEGAGKVDMAKTEQELKAKMAEKIIANLGRPFSTKAEDYEEASYLFVDEGLEDERNLEPFKKTARLSVAGALFNERGAPKYESGVLKSRLLNEETQARQTHVAGGPDNALKGVYVRRNVPFIFSAMSIDNGDNRGAVADVACTIEFADGQPVPKDESAFLFRVPNYPREKYSDQPEYFFVAKGSDKEGNVTTVRAPLYVVNTQVAYEGGRNQ